MTDNYIVKTQNRLKTKESPSLKLWHILSGAGVITLLLGSVFLGGTEKKSHHIERKEDLSSLIPKDEVKPQLLEAFAAEKREERKIQKKREDIEIPSRGQPQAPIQYADPGSMTIFVKNAQGQGSLGIPLGTEFEAAITQSYTVSGDIPIIAQVTRDIVKNNKLLVPAGSKIFGRPADLVESDLMVHFGRIVFPDGADYGFSGSARIPARVDRKSDNRALALLSGAALGSASVFAPTGATFGDTFIRNAERGAANEAGRDISNFRYREGNPIIKLTPKKIIIMVDRAS